MRAPSASRWSAFSVRPPSARRTLRVGDGVEAERGVEPVAKRRPGASGLVASDAAVPPQTASATWRARYGGLAALGEPRLELVGREPGRPGRRSRSRVDATQRVRARHDVAADDRRPPAERRPPPTSASRRPAGPRRAAAVAVAGREARRRPNVPAGGAPARPPGRRLPDDQPPARRLEERAGPRLVGADLALQLARRARRVEPAVLAAERPRQRRAVVGCGVAASSPRIHGPSSRRGGRRRPRPAAPRAPAPSRRRRGRPRLGDDRARVEPGVHPHQRDAGLARRRRGSPPGSASRRGGAAAATDGGSAPRAGTSSSGRRHDLAVVGEDDEVGLEREDRGDRRPARAAARGQDRRDAQLARAARDRRRRQRRLRAGRARRRRDDADELDVGMAASRHRLGTAEPAAAQEDRPRPGRRPRRAVTPGRSSPRGPPRRPRSPWPTAISSSIDSR